MRPNYVNWFHLESFMVQVIFLLTILKQGKGACANFMKVVVVVHNAPTFSRVSQREKVGSYVKLLLEMLIARREPMPLLVRMCVYILFYSNAVKFYVHLD